jgi:hypothetical protein
MEAKPEKPQFPAVASVRAVRTLKETDRPSLAQMQAVFGPTVALLTLSRAKSLVRKGPVWAIVGQVLSGEWDLSSRDETITTLSILDVKGTSVKMTVDNKPMFDGARMFPYVMENDVQQKVVMGSGADAIWVFLAQKQKAPRRRSPSRRRVAPTRPSRSPARPAKRPRRRPALQPSRSKSRRPARR